MILHTILPILLAVSFLISIIISALYHSFTEEAKLADEYLWKMKSCSVFDLPDNLNLKFMYKSRSTQKFDVERMIGKPKQDQDVEVEWDVENSDEIVEFETKETWKQHRSSSDIATVRYIQKNGDGIYGMKTKEVLRDKIRLPNGDIIEEIPTMKLSDKYITFDSLVEQPCYSEYRGNKYWLRSCNRDSYGKGWACIGTHYSGKLKTDIRL